MIIHISYCQISLVIWTQLAFQNSLSEFIVSIRFNIPLQQLHTASYIIIHSGRIDSVTT